MLYSTPKSILQQRLNETLGKVDENIIKDLMKISLLKTAAKDEDLLVYSELYNLLGLERFTSLISLLDGRSLQLPSKEQFKDILLVCVAYFYKEIDHKDWDEIKKILGKPDLNTIKLGIRISQLESFIKEMMEREIAKNGKKG